MKNDYGINLREHTDGSYDLEVTEREGQGVFTRATRLTKNQPKIRTVTQTSGDGCINVDGRHGRLEYILARDVLAVVIE